MLKLERGFSFELGEGFPKNPDVVEAADGAQASLASNEAIRQTIMNTCDADWHRAASALSAALKTPECC